MKEVADGERTTWLFYDLIRNATKSVNSAGQIVRKKYNALNLVTAEMVVNGLAEIKRDANGNIVLPLKWDESESFDATKSLVSYSKYDIVVKPLTVTSAQGLTLSTSGEITLFGMVCK